KEKEQVAQSLADDKAKLEDRLEKLGDEEKAKAEICDALEKALKDNNIAAEIDKKKGEVVIPFEESYFDFDSADLKDGMKQKLKQIVPVFAKTIFEKEEGKKIKSMEVVGFASPVYKGEWMDPSKIDEFSRQG